MVTWRAAAATRAQWARTSSASIAGLRYAAMRRLALLVLAGLLMGCAGSGGTRPRLTLALDFTPNAVHAPLYAAAKHGAFTIRQPGSGPDGLKLVVAGKADLG